MRIVDVESWTHASDLTRPYTIAFASTSSVELEFVRIVTETGLAGFGSAAPAEEITGETSAACRAALSPESLEFLRTQDARHLGRLLGDVEARLKATPAARAAVDMALHDLVGKALGVPVVDLLGRCHDALATSITIGIKSVAETLEEADEYVGRGFRWLKVKLGKSTEEDLERIRKLRERFGETVTIRVDMNQGYDLAETAAFFGQVETMNIEFVEQPLPANDAMEMRTLAEGIRNRIAADESLHSPEDAFRLSAAEACGIFNIKLMKCGGIRPARAIADVARAAGRELMWGCMDESVVSIAAALSVAYASPATRYLDLDGSFDLADDPAVGGFELDEGRMRLTDAAGLGVEMKTRGS